MMIGKKIYKPVESQEECDEYTALARWATDNNAMIVEREEYYECIDYPEPTIEEIKQNLISIVQIHLDNACKERGYDNGFACASYATSSVSKFKAEAEAYVLWRDAVWSYCYEQLALFEEGQRELPTDIISELPILEW